MTSIIPANMHIVDRIIRRISSRPWHKYVAPWYCYTRVTNSAEQSQQIYPLFNFVYLLGFDKIWNAKHCYKLRGWDAVTSNLLLTILNSVCRYSVLCGNYKRSKGPRESTAIQQNWSIDNPDPGSAPCISQHYIYIYVAAKIYGPPKRFCFY